MHRLRPGAFNQDRLFETRCGTLRSGRVNVLPTPSTTTARRALRSCGAPGRGIRSMTRVWRTVEHCGWLIPIGACASAAPLTDPRTLSPRKARRSPKHWQSWGRKSSSARQLSQQCHRHGKVDPDDPSASHLLAKAAGSTAVASRRAGSQIWTRICPWLIHYYGACRYLTSDRASLVPPHTIVSPGWLGNTYYPASGLSQRSSRVRVCSQRRGTRRRRACSTGSPSGAVARARRNQVPRSLSQNGSMGIFLLRSCALAVDSA